MHSADELEREGREAAGDPRRRLEAFDRLRRALVADPQRAALIPLLRSLAAGDDEKKEVEQLAARPASVRAALPGAFAYPLRGGGAALLLLGAVGASIARALFVDPLLAASRDIFQFNIGTVVALVGLLMTAVYVAAFFLDILVGTVNGADDLPEWPDVRRGGFAVDAAKVTNAFLVSWLPLWAGLAVSLVRVLQGRAPYEWIGGWGVFAALAAVALLAGTLYLPMALLVNAATSQPLACFNPFLVGRAAWRVRGDYGRVVGACVGATAVAGLLELGARGLLPAEVVGVASTLVEFYGAAVLMRLVGELHRLHRLRLGFEG